MTFERHGIKHFSPSSLNAYISHPGIWAAKYLGRQRDGGNVKMWRGTAVEKGVVNYLITGDLQASYDLAAQQYWLNVDENNARGPAADKQAALIEPMISQALLWTPPSALLANQIAIEHWVDGVPVPVIGYVDLAFEGVDVDLKTKEKMMPPSNAEIRQVSLYRAARKQPGGLLYVTGKRYEYVDVTDEMMVQGLGELEDAARKVTALLSRLTSEEILEILPIDHDNFRAPKVRIDTRMTGSASEDFEPVELTK